MRIHRALARAGVASRRSAEELVAAGRVLVNGTAASIGQIVDLDHDAITVDGRPIAAPVPDQWIVLNKPAGVMTTRADPRGRPTVFDLVPRIPGLTYVGRLDLLTEGVLLFTTDGALAHELLHPRAGLERAYTATVTGDAPAAVRAARRGVMLDDGPVRVADAEASPIGQGRWAFTVTITEGRRREVRRLCKALGLFVERLVRIRFGPVTIGALPVGRTRPVTARELELLKALAHAPA